MQEQAACAAGESPTRVSLKRDLHDLHRLRYSTQAVCEAAKHHNWETVVPV